MGRLIYMLSHKLHNKNFVKNGTLMQNEQVQRLRDENTQLRAAVMEACTEIRGYVDQQTLPSYTSLLLILTRLDGALDSVD